MRVELFAKRPLPVVGRNSMSKAIALKPRKHVQVNVKYFLPGGLAICQEQVDTLGFQIRLSDGRRQFLCRFE